MKNSGYGRIWSEERVKDEILECMRILLIDRMPTAQELVSIGRNDLHCKISKTKRYSGWAEELGILLKSCDTRTGQSYEAVVKDLLEQRGYQAERMSTKYPYDLLVNGHLKVDVKVAKPHMLRGESRVHTFAIRKVKQTCDLYVLMALDEEDHFERIFIIPSHVLNVVTLCVGQESKWNAYVDRWDLVKTYDDFFRGVG
ncbi:hypothetical protein [Brevibacillus borstelensis]|uniref:hypothetical protein n=1 Tax=Brevibacillus borstelensis TaxID=45462 RepID=UPI0030BF9C7A